MSWWGGLGRCQSTYASVRWHSGVAAGGGWYPTPARVGNLYREYRVSGAVEEIVIGRQGLAELLLTGRLRIPFGPSQEFTVTVRLASEIQRREVLTAGYSAVAVEPLGG